MGGFFKNIGIWVVIALIMLALFNAFDMGGSLTEKEIPFSSFLDRVESGTVSEVIFRGNDLIVVTNDKENFKTLSPHYPQLVPQLEKHNVRIRVEPPPSGGILMAILNSWLPMLLIIGIWLFFIRQVQGGGNRALSFGRIRIRRADEKNKTVTFKDVAGIDESKEELTEIVEFLADPAKFHKLGERSLEVFC